jgi:hypothetical protein
MMTLNERLIWAATFAHVMDKYEHGAHVLSVVHEACGRAAFNVAQFRFAAKNEKELAALDLPPSSGIPKEAARLLQQMADSLEG